jgi:hypothetical protein
VSIKKKFVTAVTTAGLLAGLFGSAFVPAAYAVSDATAAFTAGTATEDYASATVAYYSAALNPTVAYTITTDTGDDGVYEFSVSGGTIRTCVWAGTDGNTVTAGITTTTSCTMDGVDNTGTFTLVASLNKLAAGASATVALADPDGDNLISAGVATITGVAATETAGALSTSKTKAAIKVDYDGNGTGGETTDLPDTTISGVDYISTAQNLGSLAIFTGVLKNGYDVALNVDTPIIATVTEGNYVNCDEVPGNGVTDGVANVVVLAVNDATSDFECEVISADGAEGAGGAWTLTITSVTGTVLDSFSAGFLGEIASVTLAASYSQIPSDLDAEVTDFWTVSAKDASGRAYALKDLIDSDLQETDNLKVYDIADTTKAELANTAAADADTDGIFDLDANICEDGDGPTVANGYETRSVTLQLEDGAGATVASNSVTITCGVDTDTALVVASVKFATAKVAPGASLKAQVYMEDANGFVPAQGIYPSGAITGFVLTGGTGDLDSGDISDANADTIAAGGFIESSVVAPITVGTTISLAHAATESLARAYVTSDAYEATLTVGTKKLKATADFGPAAAKKKIAFVLENASGTTKTFYRRASSDGVATYTLGLRGTWTVYATFGDEISDTGTMKK